MYVAEHTAFMVHNYSTGAQGKGHELKAQMDFTDKGLNEAFKKIYGGFLTPHEMELVIAGKDYWFNKEETDARRKAMIEKDTETLERLAEEKKGK
jgi:ATP-dependent protease ClpP protease subunit